MRDRRSGVLPQTTIAHCATRTSDVTMIQEMGWLVNKSFFLFSLSKFAESGHFLNFVNIALPGIISIFWGQRRANCQFALLPPNLLRRYVTWLPGQEAPTMLSTTGSSNPTPGSAFQRIRCHILLCDQKKCHFVPAPEPGP